MFIVLEIPLSGYRYLRVIDIPRLDIQHLYDVRIIREIKLPRIKVNDIITSIVTSNVSSTRIRVRLQ